jgi:hypothetical protein
VKTGEAALEWAREARRRAETVRAEAEAAKRRVSVTTDAMRANRKRIMEHNRGRSD